MRNDRPDYRPSFIAVPLAIPVAIAYRSTARRPVSDSRGKKRPYQNRLSLAVLCRYARAYWTDRLAGNGARTDSIRRHRGAETLAHATPDRDTARTARDTNHKLGNLYPAAYSYRVSHLHTHTDRNADPDRDADSDLYTLSDFDARAHLHAPIFAITNG